MTCDPNINKLAREHGISRWTSRWRLKKGLPLDEALKPPTKHEAATDQAGSAVMPLLFALLCFAIAVPALLAALVAAHVWLATTIVLRFLAGAYVRAALWFGVLVVLICIELAVAPAHAGYGPRVGPPLPDAMTGWWFTDTEANASGMTHCRADDADCGNYFVGQNLYGEGDHTCVVMKVEKFNDQYIVQGRCNDVGDHSRVFELRDGKLFVYPLGS
jgi:hypothetical protein